MTIQDPRPLAPFETTVELLTALHWRIEPPFAPSLPLSEQADLLGRCIAAQINSVASRITEADCDFAICSTVMSGNVLEGRDFLSAIERHGGQRPLAIVHTYMCVGWGFTVRFFLRHTDARLLLLVIPDVDVHDFRYHYQHREIGQAGFGISTLLLRLPERRTCDGPLTGGPYPESAFKEFIRALRQRHAALPRTMTFMPFFTAALGGMAERQIGADIVTRNWYDVYGHCFGSDPWIGLIKWLQDNPLTGRQIITAGAVAYNGYYTLCDFVVSPKTLTEFRTLNGSTESLAMAIGPDRRLHMTADQGT